MLAKMIVEKHLLYRKVWLLNDNKISQGRLLAINFTQRAEIAEQYTARQNNGAADAADDEV